MDNISNSSSLPTSEIDKEDLIGLYSNMLLSRMIEEKMLILLRQGKISKWFSGIGQEAISTGVSMALNDDEFILPMHRNLGVFTSRNIDLVQLFAQWQGKKEGFTKGRDRSFHFGSISNAIVGMISHLGPQLGVACGIALADQLNKSQKITAVFTGDGGTSQGDFHEALNIASVWNLPVLFCIENNGYGLSTAINEQYNCKNLADRGLGYGMESHIIDGNNVKEIFSMVKKISNDLRTNPRPVLLEFKTFRMRGHEEASGIDYVPKELFQFWTKKDPLTSLENGLLETHVFNKNYIEELKLTHQQKIDISWEKALLYSEIIPDAKEELDDIFKPSDESVQFSDINKTDHKELRLVDAISEALDLSLAKHNNLVIMGQDIAEYGGVFKVTKGFLEKFGKDRVRNTPLCESGIIEVAMGLSIANFKSIVEIQFADFVSSGFNPIVNYLAKSYYRWKQNADVVIRLPCGGGVNAGPFHSQTNESWFTKVPGLKVIYPAFPIDAKGLLNAAINDPNPVLFFEHKALYRSTKQQVPVSYYTTPIGKASKIISGNDMTIITYGLSVHWALEILNNNKHIDADLIDLRTLSPLDFQTIVSSVSKTNKVIICHEDTLNNSIASDISAHLTEYYFDQLDAPIMRVGSMNTPIPFNSNLEKQYLSKHEFETAILKLHRY